MNITHELEKRFKVFVHIKRIYHHQSSLVQLIRNKIQPFRITHVSHSSFSSREIFGILLAVKIKTASRITFALPPQSVSPAPTNVFDPIHPPSPQMPPTTTAISIETQTEHYSFSSFHQARQSQTDFIETSNQSIQTDSTNQMQLISTATQHQSDQHIVCRDLTNCTCVEQLVKTRQFLVDVTNKLQLPTVCSLERNSLLFILFIE